MAFSADITLDDDAGTDMVYKTYRRDGFNTDRLLSTSTLTLPGYMKVRHQTESKPWKGVKDAFIQDRHTVSFTQAVDIGVGVIAQPEVHFSIVMPRHTLVTRAMLDKLIANAIDFLQDGTATTWANKLNVTELLINQS